VSFGRVRHSTLERDVERRCPDAATFRQRLAEVCAAHLPLASSVEVTAELLRLAHPQLNAIETQAAEARRMMTGGNVPESRTVKETNTITSSVRRHPEAFDDTQDAAAPARAPRRGVWLAAAAVLLGGGISYAIFSAPPKSPSASIAVPVEPKPAPPSPPPAAPSEPAAATAPVEASNEPGPRARKIRKTGEETPTKTAPSATVAPVATPAPAPPPPARPSLTDNPY